MGLFLEANSRELQSISIALAPVDFKIYIHSFNQQMRRCQK